MSRVEAVGEQTSLADRKRRAGQRLIVGFTGTSPSPEFKAFCKEAAPAGFILFARNIEDPAQVRELNRELASLVPSHSPALLSVDQEGGRVLRVRDTPWPPMRQVGNMNHPPTTAQLARAMSDELRAMGFNLNFAPCADVDSNPKNPVIGDRSFSRSPETCARHVIATMHGMHDRGVISCLKHFPGHGDTSVDSHLDLPVVDKDVDELEAVERVPFAAGVAAGAPMVMTSHVVFPALDEHYPATMSEPIMRGWLRDGMGFQGVICSDDMEMKAVRGRYPLEQQLDLACRATVDMFIVSKELPLCWDSWEDLVRQQETDPTHDLLAQDSLRRVMTLRRRFLIDPPRAPDLDVVGSRAFKMLAADIRARGEGLV